MTKEQTFRAIIEGEIRKALREVYKLDTLDMTEAQRLLVDKISSSIYRIVGKSMTVEEFKEKFYATTDAVQKD
jgi:pyruvate/2-oxoacid:ferredoxin oxidoreductase alpha subunit